MTNFEKGFTSEERDIGAEAVALALEHMRLSFAAAINLKRREKSKAVMAQRDMRRRISRGEEGQEVRAAELTNIIAAFDDVIAGLETELAWQNAEAEEGKRRC